MLNTITINMANQVDITVEIRENRLCFLTCRGTPRCCASGINDKDTVVVTDEDLGKKLPDRNLEIDQEGQKRFNR